MTEPRPQEEQTPAPVQLSLSRPVIAAQPRVSLSTIFIRNRLPNGSSDLSVDIVSMPNGHAGTLGFKDNDGFTMNYEMGTDALLEIIANELLSEQDRGAISAPLFIQQRALGREKNPLMDYAIERDRKGNRFAVVTFTAEDGKPQSYKMSDETVSAVLRNPSVNEFDRKTLTMALHYLRSHAYSAGAPGLAQR